MRISKPLSNFFLYLLGLNVTLLAALMFKYQEQFDPEQRIAAWLGVGGLGVLTVIMAIFKFVMQRSNQHAERANDLIGRHDEQAEAHSRDSKKLWRWGLGVAIAMLIVAVFVFVVQRNLQH